ncbi:hypothetical protein BGX30_003755, partial [Mortierella sp. GBA39]
MNNRIIGPSDPRIIGSSDHLTIEPSDHRIIASPDNRIIGPSDPRIIGSSDHLTIEPSDHRIIASPDNRIIGPSDPRIIVPSDHLNSGSVRTIITPCRSELATMTTQGLWDLIHRLVKAGILNETAVDPSIFGEIQVDFLGVLFGYITSTENAIFQRSCKKQVVAVKRGPRLHRYQIFKRSRKPPMEYDNDLVNCVDRILRKSKLDPNGSFLHVDGFVSVQKSLTRDGRTSRRTAAV